MGVSRTTITPRPVGVAIAAVLVGVLGFLLLLSGVLYVVGLPGSELIGLPSGLFGLGGLSAGLVALIVGIILLALASGLWRLRMWAFALTLLFILFELVSFAVDRGILTIGFFFFLLVFVYLLTIANRFR